jgi:hypothetical protein
VFQVATTEASILDTIKKKLMVGAGDQAFDLDIMTHINGVFLNLHQLGIGPDSGFEIEGPEATWDTFLGATHSPLLNAVKQYVYFKVRLAFDPPSTSFHIASMEKQITELEFRLLILRDELAESDTGIVEPVLPAAETT